MSSSSSSVMEAQCAHATPQGRTCIIPYSRSHFLFYMYPAQKTKKSTFECVTWAISHYLLQKKRDNLQRNTPVHQQRNLIKNTSKYRADVYPGADPSQARVLSQRGLQEEQGDAAQHQEQQVRYKEHTCTHTHRHKRGRRFCCEHNTDVNSLKTDKQGFTSSVLVAEVRKPPHVAQADDLPRHGQEELSLAGPLAPGMQAVIFGGFFPVGEGSSVEQ